MAYRLSLDIGANSLGWCLLNLDSAGTPCGVRDIGVRVFPDGRDPKTLASLAAERRLARAMRRRRDRYLQRRTALLNVLVQYGLLPAEETARQALVRLDPYVLRRDALHRKLTLHELGRAIFHLNQRRGFASNRKTDRANDAEQGKIKIASDKLQAEIARAGLPTLGAWLAERHDRQQGVRARLVGSGAKAEYPFYPTRDLIRNEFETIWSVQGSWNPSLSNAARESIAGVLFHQRPLKAPMVGRCWLEPDEFRAPKALPSTQAFRIAQDLSHLTIRRTGETDIDLTDAERAKLSNLLNAGSDLSFNQIRKALGLTRGETFNLESKAREKLKGAETAARLAGKKGPLATAWVSLNMASRDALVIALLDAETPDAAVAALGARGISAEAVPAAVSPMIPRNGVSAVRRTPPFMLRSISCGMWSTRSSPGTDTPRRSSWKCSAS